MDETRYGEQALDDERVTEASTEADLFGRARRLANASLILGIFASCLPWVGTALLNALGFQAERRPPFVGTLIPVSDVPFEVARIASLLVALAAIVVGHLAISRGGGTRGRLIGALFFCPLAGLLIFLFTPVATYLSQVVPFYGELAFYALIATPVAFLIVHLVAGFRRVRRTGGMIWRPVMGAMLGYFNVALVALLTLSLFGKVSINADMSVCSKNLRGIESALREYAKENRGMFPPLSSQPGVLMFSPEAIPQKESIGSSLTCPTIRFAGRQTAGAANPFDDQSYFYLGYALRNDDAVEAFAQAYRKKIAAGGSFDEDLVVEDGEGTHVLHRLSVDAREVLRASQERLSISPNAGKLPAYQDPGLETDDVPILIERGVRHKNIDYLEGPMIRGAWVLYLNDGVQFVEEGTWPLTEKTQRILAELAE